MVKFKKYSKRYEYRIHVGKKENELTLKEIIFVLMFKNIFCVLKIFMLN
jgi:hypothetical protein